MKVDLPSFANHLKKQYQAAKSGKSGMNLGYLFFPKNIREKSENLIIFRYNKGNVSERVWASL